MPGDAEFLWVGPNDLAPERSLSKLKFGRFLIAARADALAGGRADNKMLPITAPGPGGSPLARQCSESDWTGPGLEALVPQKCLS